MGKVTGFLEFERQSESYEAPLARVKHYKEFVLALSDEQAKVQGARCMDCGIPFCNNGCPVNNIIPDFNDLVYRQDWKAAIGVLHSTNNFPEFTGRICPAPCEAACTLNIAGEYMPTPDDVATSSARREIERRLITWNLFRHALIDEREWIDCTERAQFPPGRNGPHRQRWGVRMTARRVSGWSMCTAVAAMSSRSLMSLAATMCQPLFDGRSVSRST